MTFNRTLAPVALLVAVLAVSVASAQDHPTTGNKAEKHEHAAKAAKSEHSASANSLVAVAATDDDLSTFVAAVKAAGLAEKLQGKGPYTVFAPSNAAFARLPAGTVDELLKPANKARLAGILACHVVPGKLMARDVKTMKATNVSGQDLAVEVQDGKVTVDGARVIETDLVADNGVIHVIDTVIMPEDGEKTTQDAPKDHPAH